MDSQKIADILDGAALHKQATEQLHLEKHYGLEEAYEIQKKVVQNRLDRGEVPTGVKMGFTSEAKRKQMGVHDLIWGRLTDKMEVSNGARLDLTRHIHPRVEPEIAFRIKQNLESPISLDTCMDVIDGIALALEIIDSRYENFKFSLEDVVADNCSSSAYVLGEWVSPDFPIRENTLELWIDDKMVHSNSPDAIMGNPFQSLVDAVRLSLQNRVVLEAGAIVLAGAVTPAVYLQANQKIECVAGSMPKVQMFT